MVYVWKTKRELIAQRRANHLRPLHCDAFVYSYDQVIVRKGRPNRKRPIVGEIHFQQAKLGTEAITHESVHAAASLLGRLKFNFADLNKRDGPRNNGEELLARVTGKLARRIVAKFYDLKVIH